MARALRRIQAPISQINIMVGFLVRVQATREIDVPSYRAQGRERFHKVRLTLALGELAWEEKGVFHC